MRGKTLSVIASAIVLVNLIAGFLYPRTDVFNNLMNSFSAFAVIYMVLRLFSAGKMATLPFALMVVFGLCGVCKLVASLFPGNHWNYLVVLVLLTTLAETVLLMLAYVVWKERRQAGHAG